MSAARVVAVAPGSPAALAGVTVGDEIVAVDGAAPRDVIEWRFATDEADLELDVVRGGLTITIAVAKRAGEPLGAEVHSPVFDEVQTCDNHCAFCFIYQLPPDQRASLYVKDDDYRLSFLYGNFTTLTRFTEMDLERVITEGLSPLNVSIHATDADLRAEMLRNRRGGISLRWLRALLDHGITVHGQVVVCPGVNDGDALDATLCGVLDRYPELASLCAVPLGVSRFNREPSMRAHTRAEAARVVEIVERWQARFLRVLGRRLAFCADEYYLLAGRPFPEIEAYEDVAMHEDGVGMARTFERELMGVVEEPTGTRSGFFAAVDGAPATGYRAPRNPVLGWGGSNTQHDGSVTIALRPSRTAPVGVITSIYGAEVLRPLLAELHLDHVRIVEVANEFFGGNIAVTGLLVGADIARALAGEPEGHRYLLPDVCLSEGRFLDGLTVADLPRHVEVVAADGIALRRALGLARAAVPA